MPFAPNKSPRPLSFRHLGKVGDTTKPKQTQTKRFQTFPRLSPKEQRHGWMDLHHIHGKKPFKHALRIRWHLIAWREYSNERQLLPNVKREAGDMNHTTPTATSTIGRSCHDGHKNIAMRHCSACADSTSVWILSWQNEILAQNHTSQGRKKRTSSRTSMMNVLPTTLIKRGMRFR